MSTETQQKAGHLQIFKLNKALKLAERWVDNMTKATEDEPTDVEPEARPSRLGLGAKVSRQSKIGPLNDPVARKLQARLNAGKRNASNKAEFTPSTGEGHGDNDEDEDEDLESRTSIFVKKRAVPPTSSLHASKKQK